MKRWIESQTQKNSDTNFIGSTKSYCVYDVSSGFFRKRSGRRALLRHASSWIGWCGTGRNVVPTDFSNVVSCTIHNHNLKGCISRLPNLSSWWFALTGKIAWFNHSRHLFVGFFWRHASMLTSIRLLKPSQRVPESESSGKIDGTVWFLRLPIYFSRLNGKHFKDIK